MNDMKAGDKVKWIDKGHGGLERECQIIAVFKIEDALNKNVIGRILYRLDFSGVEFHVFSEEVRPIK